MAVVVVLVAAASVVGVVVVVCGSRVGTMATTMEAVGGRHLNRVKIVGFGFCIKQSINSLQLVPAVGGEGCLAQTLWTSIGSGTL